ncbi:MAG: hypothetical protein JWQ18_3612, partial [Conexibacter sp.]|nr:hypothetical protein [Conexibacter sp.]
FNLDDIDGDGFADLVGRDSAGNVAVGRSTGTTFGAATALTTLAPSYSVMRVADVDGDTNGDVVGENPTTGQTQIVLTDGSAATDRLDGGPWPAGYTFILADIDGDGYADAVGRDVNSGAVRVGISSGLSFDLDSGTWTIPANADFGATDVDGDGEADLIYRPSGGTSVYVRSSSQTSTGMGFSTGVIWGAWSQNRALSTGDIGGDGKSDLISRDTSNSAMYVARSHEQVPQGESVADDPAPAAATSPSFAAPLAVDGPDECHNSSTMKIAAADDGRFLYNPTVDPVRAAQRIALLGAEVVRLNVYWGIFENAGSTPTYNWQRLIDAIDAIKATKIANNPNCPRSLAVHLTITGSVAKQCKMDNFSSSRDCDPNSPSTGVNPDPAKFEAFVTAVAQKFNGQADTYAIWNEPNLGGKKPHFLATGLDSNGLVKPILTARLYRSLYLAGYHGIRTVNSTVPVFIGELSEQLNSAQPATGPKTHHHGYTAMDYLAAAVQPVTGDTARVQADGLAMHPYQHRISPNHRGIPSEDGIGKLRAPLRDPKHQRLSGIQATLQYLYDKKGVSGTSGSSWLSTSGSSPGKVPLYITEFGYLNLPLKGAKPSAAIHTEAQRAGVRGQLDPEPHGIPLPNGLYPKAMAEARYGDARWFTLYSLTESAHSVVSAGPNPVVTGYEGDFDTGLIAADGFDTGADVTGTRPYGISSNNSGTLNPQPRKAYCAIWKSLTDLHYPTQPSGPSPFSGVAPNPCS